MGLWTKKSIHQLMHEVEGTGEPTLKRSLSALNLTTLGIGAIIGAGHLRPHRTAAAQYAGPAIVAVLHRSPVWPALFAGLCYAEFASMIPIAGSAYTYGYATLGEFVAWIIGWDLILEYLFAASTVSVGWSGYFTKFMRHAGVLAAGGPDERAVHLDGRIRVRAHGCDPQPAGRAARRLPDHAARDRHPGVGRLQQRDRDRQGDDRASRDRLRRLLRHTGQLAPVRARRTPGSSASSAGAASCAARRVIFFAYIGFDAVSTAAQEAKNPQRDLPIGILGSLGVCTVLYVLMALVMTGVAHYTELERPRPGVRGDRPRRPGAGLAQADRGTRRDRGARFGRARDAPRPAAHLLLDGARRPAPTGVRQGAPEVPDAVPFDDHHGQRGWAHRRAVPDRHPRASWCRSARCSRSSS